MTSFNGYENNLNSSKRAWILIIMEQLMIETIPSTFIEIFTSSLIHTYHSLRPAYISLFEHPRVSFSMFVMDNYSHKSHETYFIERQKWYRAHVFCELTGFYRWLIRWWPIHTTDDVQTHETMVWQSMIFIDTHLNNLWCATKRTQSILRWMIWRCVWITPKGTCSWLCQQDDKNRLWNQRSENETSTDKESISWG